MINPFTWFEVHAVDHCNMRCTHCNNHIPHLKKREYKADEYFPAIDALVRRGVLFEMIGIIGGEPFLHSDLAGFITAIKGRYKAKIKCNTNATWLSDKNIEKFKPALSAMDVLMVTPYRTVVEKMGRDNYYALVDRLKQYCEIVVNEWLFEFVEMGFYTEPELPMKICYQAQCRNLTPDGKLYRCAVAAYHESSPKVTKEFHDACDDSIYYDMHTEERDFHKWLDNYPGNACSYCHYWKATWTPWTETR